MTRPTMPANGTANWGTGLRDAVYAVSDRVDTLFTSSDLTTYSLPAFTHVAHRCAANVWPEESKEGLEDTIRSGFLPELDLQQLADGTLVACHDDTVDRTMSNITTGNVSAKTVAQWRSAKIKPAIVGGKTGTPVFWEDILDLYGGRTLLVPELKDTDTAGTTAYIASIQRRHLENSVITQCFGYTTCQQLATAGIEAMYLSTNLPAQSGATIKAAGINFVCFSLAGNVTGANVTTLKAAGLKVFFYTVDDLTEQAAAVALGADGVFSNDPWLSAGAIPWTTSDNFAEGIRPKGMYNYYYSGSTVTDVAEPIQLNGNALGYSGGNNPLPYTYLPQFGLITRPCRLSARLHFGLTSSLTTNLGFTLCGPGTGLFQDAARTGQNAFNFVCRRNGQLQAWNFVNGSATSSIVAAPSSVNAAINVVAPLATEAVVDFSVVLTLTTIQLIAQSPRYFSTDGTTTTAPPAYGYFTTGAVADTNVLSGGYELYLRHNTAGAGWISDVRVTLG